MRACGRPSLCALRSVSLFFTLRQNADWLVGSIVDYFGIVLVWYVLAVVNRGEVDVRSLICVAAVAAGFQVRVGGASTVCVIALAADRLEKMDAREPSYAE